MGSSPSTANRQNYALAHQQVLGQCYDAETPNGRAIRVSPYQGLDAEREGLFTFGDGTHGKLGHGGEVQCINPSLVSYFSEKIVAQVAAGLNHSLVLTDQSEVFSFGWNAYGQLGHGTKRDSHKPKPISTLLDRRVVSCAAGDNHSLVLCEDGLYSFGWGLYGQLGHGNKNNQSTPKKIQYFGSREVEQFVAGASHTLVLCRDGSLYSFGDGNHLQLGHPERRAVFAPKLVLFFEGKKVNLIAAGAAHSVVACDDGLYTFGAGGYGQLGFGFIVQSMPRAVDFFDSSHRRTVRSLACGSNHTVVATNDGMYAFGDGRHGQLGQTVDKAEQGNPKCIGFFENHKVDALACGSRHTLVLCAEGLFGFGCCDEGQMGINSLQSTVMPESIHFFSAQRVTCIAAGGTHSIVACYPVSGTHTNESGGSTLLPTMEAIRKQISETQALFAAQPPTAAPIARGDLLSPKARSKSMDLARSIEGDDLKGWTKQCLLGQGSSGRVYLGILTGRYVGQFVAVKVIELGTLTNQKQVEKLAVEISLMREYQHPNIVQYYGCEVDREDNVLNIMMEYTPGGSISSLIAKSAKGCIEDMGLLKHFTRQILQGLSYLHQNGIIHRDIKGDNILVTETGSVKLADFGCSKRIGELASTSRNGADTFVGTPFWMAPEVITDEQVGYGVKADIWSLGCTMVEMLTGKPPWQEFKTMWSAIYHIANSTGKPTGIPEDLLPSLQNFLNLCFERNTEKRPSALELLQHAWLTANSDASFLPALDPATRKRSVSVARQPLPDDLPAPTAPTLPAAEPWPSPSRSPHFLPTIERNRSPSPVEAEEC
eukprot:GGOE01047080.1.p1 GENE.GGOE01047080.1~~GGOE01047080.1.p1  ORF type:complete len:848 (-),score=221.65 GGOE01047080.1:951-3422(-)